MQTQHATVEIKTPPYWQESALFKLLPGQIPEDPEGQQKWLTAMKRAGGEQTEIVITSYQVQHLLTLRSCLFNILLIRFPTVLFSKAS